MKFLRIFDWHVLAVAALAVAATALSMRVGLRADLPSELIAVAIVFPIVFSITAAYRRREDALVALGQIKAVVASLYYAHRDWTPNAAVHAERSARIGRAMYAAVCRALSCRKAERRDALSAAAETFSEMSLSIEGLRAAGLNPTEVSRANQYLNRAMAEFERLLTILQYRTPSSLRAYSKVYLNVFPILFAPFYAHVAEEAGVAAVGYAVALAFAVVLVGLDNIQDRLENPFDARDADDVRLGGEDELICLPSVAEDPEALGPLRASG